MSYDPNWFYSSLAQCAAAVVGLLGAVLATRLQEQYVNARVSYEGVAKLLRQFRQDVCSRIHAIESFASFADRRIREIEAALSRKETQLIVTQEIRFWGDSSSGTGWSIEINEDVLSNYQTLHSLVEPTVALLAPHAKLHTVKEAAAVEQSILALENTVPPELRSIFEGWRDRITAIENANINHQRAASVRVLAIVTVILTWLCIFGLVIPLAFLSAYAVTSKNILLAAFALGIVAIPGYISLELIRIFQMRNVDIDRTI